VKIKSLTLLLLAFVLFGSSLALAQDCSQCPPPKDPEDWGTSVSLGFNLTEGNSSTLLFTSGIAASREKDGHLWDLRAGAAYGENEVDSTSTTTDADGNEVTETVTEDQQTVGEVTALAKYGRLLTDRLYTGAQVDFLHDSIQDIKYRVTIGVPLGYFLIKEDNLRFNIEVGPSYTFTKTGPDEINSAGWFASERLEWDISETAKFFEQVTYNGSFEGDDLEGGRSFSASDNYYIVAEAGLEAALSSNMSLVVAVRDDYINIVGDGLERNDIAIVSALKIAL